MLPSSSVAIGVNAFGTPAVHGRRKTAALKEHDSPASAANGSGISAYALEDTPTLLRRAALGSPISPTPSSPTSALRASIKKGGWLAAVIAIGVFLLLLSSSMRYGGRVTASPASSNDGIEVHQLRQENVALHEQEKTFAGQCWRARGGRSSVHHVLSYCATTEPVQYVKIEPHETVALYFHYPSAKTSNANTAAAASLFQVTTVLGQHLEHETLVGHVAPGGHLSTTAQAGSKYRVRDEATKRPLLSLYEAGWEAEQHVDIVSQYLVDLEFELAPSTPLHEAAAIFWTWGDANDKMIFAREHLASELDKPGQVIKLSGVAPGEELIVRHSAQRGVPVGPDSQEVLLKVVAQEKPQTQRHLVVIPPRAAPKTRLFKRK